VYDDMVSKVVVVVVLMSWRGWRLHPFHMSVPPFLVYKSICPFLVDAIVRLFNMSVR
jgi:hypothetical protein